jgi:putative membrane protein
MRRTTVLAALLAAGLGLALAAYAADPDKDKDKKDADKDQKALADPEFVFKASAAGLAEVNLGRLAADRASNADVKKFGQQMADEHMKANQDLIKLADGKRFRLPPTMDREHAQAAERLARLRGEEFDREFMKQMVKDHEEAVALFEAQAKDSKDEELKTWVNKALPTLRDHLKMAHDVAGKVGEGKKDGDKDKKDSDKDKKDIDKDKDKKDTDKDKKDIDKDKKPTDKDKDKAPDKE